MTDSGILDQVFRISALRWEKREALKVALEASKWGLAGWDRICYHKLRGVRGISKLNFPVPLTNCTDGTNSKKMLGNENYRDGKPTLPFSLDLMAKPSFVLLNKLCTVQLIILKSSKIICMASKYWFSQIFWNSSYDRGQEWEIWLLFFSSRFASFVNLYHRVIPSLSVQSVV